MATDNSKAVEPVDPYGTYGDPWWWLGMLVTDLIFRQPAYERRGLYVEGRHAAPRGDRKYMRAYGHLQSLAATNYCGLVTNAATQRMEVRHFNFGEGPDEDARAIWSWNDMDMQSDLINSNCAKYGLSYALVGDIENDQYGNGYPTITALDPRTAIVYRDPLRPTRSLAALRLWEDDLLGRVVAVLYLPDQCYAYVGPRIPVLEGMTLQGVRETLMGLNGGPGAFQLVETAPNNIGQVPVVEFTWRPGSGRLPEGEVGADVRNIQDRLNQTIFDRISISLSQAFKQRYVSGISLKDKTTGQKAAPFDASPTTLWAVEDQNAKFGEFQSADISQILESIRDDVGDIAAITQTPAYYLMGKMANISGETLAQAETGLVKKVKQRQKSMGWSYEAVMKLCFAYMDDDRAGSVEAKTIWNDPEQNALTDQAAAAAQFISSNIPVNVVMERVGGFSEDQITASQEFADEQAALQAEQDQAQMEMLGEQQDHQQGMDKGQQQLDKKTQADDHQVATIQAKAAMKKASQNPRTATNGGGNPRAKKSSLKKPSK